MRRGLRLEAIHMTTNPDLLRDNLGDLYLKRTVGDVSERVFQRELAERTVDLYRAVIQRSLEADEKLLADHHSISSHFRLTQSVLREPEQNATSLFLTDRRLLRLRSIVMPDQPPTADRKDRTVVDGIRLDRIRGLFPKRQFKMGEAAVGAVMCLFAAFFSSWLAITGPFLIGLGILGILHSILLPMRWIEVRSADGSLIQDPIIIYALRKKSARTLVRSLKERIKPT
jgi:hypothetical protein